MTKAQDKEYERRVKIQKEIYKDILPKSEKRHRTWADIKSYKNCGSNDILLMSANALYIEGYNDCKNDAQAFFQELLDEYEIPNKFIEKICADSFIRQVIEEEVEEVIACVKQSHNNESIIGFIKERLLIK